MDTQVKQVDPKITREALSNAHGDWYEWLLAISAWNTFVTNPQANLAIPLPNISRFDVAYLYNIELTELIEDLRNKVQSVAQVQLITSNPDFVIIQREVANQMINNPQLIKQFDTSHIEYLNSIYKDFTNSCGFEQILGYVSVKTSFRPDRRLQIAHEGSLMKAIYIHLQTRKWVISPPGLKYYAIATKVGKSDRNALRTVATHSITTVSSLPQAAVDEVFAVNSLQDADLIFQQILV
ncbi:UNVERIFIED_CONTAM: hypothetical protein GTU68_057456 [Idotea baltica]|nr:hypothetical protein [Idotea baltica]